MSEVVAIIGASSKEDRYAFKAQRLLMEKGHEVVPVSPLGKSVLGVEGFGSLTDYPGKIDTVTLYVGPARQDGILADLLSKAPARVLFNPGTENAGVEEKLRQAGVAVERACTLVLLRTGQF